MEVIKIKYFGDTKHLEKIEIGDWIDLRVSEEIVLEVGEFRLLPLSVAMELPKGFEAILAPRSSTFEKYGIIMTNSIGVIDEAYCGDNDQWHFPAYCLVGKEFRNGKMVTVIPKGERICQFRIQEHQPELELLTVEILGNADRGGIGSTGRD